MLSSTFRMRIPVRSSDYSRWEFMVYLSAKKLLHWRTEPHGVLSCFFHNSGFWIHWIVEFWLLSSRKSSESRWCAKQKVGSEKVCCMLPEPTSIVSFFVSSVVDSFLESKIIKDLTNSGKGDNCFITQKKSKPWLDSERMSENFSWCYKNLTCFDVCLFWFNIMFSKFRSWGTIHKLGACSLRVSIAIVNVGHWMKGGK